MSYNYTTFQQALAIEMVIPNANPENAGFQAILPTLIDQAEQSCYRDLNLLTAISSQIFATRALQRLLSFTAASGQQQILVAENVNVLLATGERHQMYPATRDFLTACYGGPQSAAEPHYFAMNDDQTFVLGPWPDQVYSIEVVGETRPAPLYSAAPGDGTQTTFLTQVLPDLFLAAAMVAASGYQKNFGSQADDPKMALSWAAMYAQALKSAQQEETQKRFHGWQAMTSQASPPPTPPPPPPGG